jgi:nitric oxide reductase large subunit
LEIEMIETTTKRGFLLSRGWIQAVILVFLFGFFVQGFLAYRTYTGEPPIPGKVIDPDGHLLFTPPNRVMATSKLFAATERKLSPRSLWQRQTFSTNG